MSTSTPDNQKVKATRPWVSQQTESGPGDANPPFPVVTSEGSRPDYGKWFMSLTLSTVVHLLVIFVLAQLIMSIPAQTAYVQVDTSWEDSLDQSPVLEEIEIEPVQEV
ncbi:MAG: hypothetical protein R3C11_21755 [Planctomycetaceae bacterium]